MPKSKIFLQQFCHNALPSRANLLRKGIQVDPICPACLAEIEDIDHLFVGCPMVKKTWDLAVSHNWLLSFPFPHLPTSIREGLHDLYTKRSISLTRVVILLWSIWKICNTMIFNHDIPKPMDSLVRAKHNWAEWRLRTSGSHLCSLHPPSTPPFHKPTQLIGWRSPLGGYIKLNFDDTHSSCGVATGLLF